MRNNLFSSKSKGSAFRKQKRLFLFAAEGHNCTERNYFRGFNADYKDVSIRYANGSSTDPVGLVNELIKAMNSFDFSYEDGDRAFCFIDADCNSTKDVQIEEARRIAIEYKIQIIVSNPCFELWYICHFTGSPHHYSSSGSLIADMDSYIAGYEKSDPSIYEGLKDRMGDAIQNAEKLESSCLRRGLILHKSDFSPSTEVYKVIRQIINND